MVETCIQYGQDARDALRRGVTKLARTVKVTLGPSGKAVAIQNSCDSPSFSRDGATVASQIILNNPIENMGAQMIKEVAARCSIDAGDGTTTAIVYAEAIFLQGLRNVAAGANPIEVQSGIAKAVMVIVTELKRISRTVTTPSDIARVGFCAAHQDEDILLILAKAIDLVGGTGVITVEEGQSRETVVEYLQGMQFNKGYASSYFVTDQPKLNCTLEDAFVLIHENKLNSAVKLLPLLSKVAEAGKPLLIIAEDFSSDVLATLIINISRAALKVCAVRAPSFGSSRKDLLDDIAMLTKGRAITDVLGLDIEKLGLEDLGRAKKIVVDSNTTTIIVDSNHSAVMNARLAELKKEIDSHPDKYEQQLLRERVARLSGGIAQIIVGGSTEPEIKARKARFDDAVHACRAAVEEGILPGGGSAVLRTRKLLLALKRSCVGDEQVGVDIIWKAVAAPIIQIARNAGHNGSVVADVVEQSTELNYGFDAITGEYGNLIEMGVLVSTKVERIAFEKAASIAGLLLNTAAVISRI